MSAEMTSRQRAENALLEARESAFASGAQYLATVAIVHAVLHLADTIAAAAGPKRPRRTS
jgi:hypothetical protein